MGAFSFDVALGREVELYNRVVSNDPTNSALKMIILAAATLQADSVLRQYETVADIISGGNLEVTNTNYARKTLTDAVLDPIFFDHSNSQILLTLPLQTFATILAGNSWSKGVVAYDNDTTSGTDANLIPVTAFDIRYAGSVVVPNGGNIIVDLSSGWELSRSG